MPQEQTKVCVSVSDEKIEKLIHMAVMEKLSKNSDAMISKVVEIALKAKKDNYSNTTLFEAHTHAMIREVAEEAFGEWLKKKRALVKKAMIARLEKDGKAATIADAMINGLSTSYRFCFDAALHVVEKD